MTLPALLKKVGIDVQLYVAVDGRIFTHEKERGSEAQVVRRAIQPHTFHGGPDPEDSAANAAPWWTTDTVRKDLDIAEMRSSFPKVRVYDDADILGYALEIDTGRGSFDCLVMPRRDGSIPLVEVTRPKALGRQEGGRFRRSPHLYDSGALCLADRSDWHSSEYRSADAVAWAAHWLACYTEWRISGQWPRIGFVRR